MEVALLLGAGAYTAHALYGGGKQPKVDLSPSEIAARMIESPREFSMHEGRVRGIIAPHSNASSGRVPWSITNPPYNIYRAGDAGNTQMPVERMLALNANTLEHERLIVAEELAAGRQHYARKRGQAIFTAYSRELHLPNEDPNDAPRTTNAAGWMWMPPDPTQSDYNDAGRLAAYMPPDDRLITPDAVYFTNPGQTWRNTISQH